MPSAFRFAEPWWGLLGLLALAPWLAHRLRPRIPWPLSPDLLEADRLPGRGMARLPVVLRTLAILALVAALARPQTPLGEEPAQATGIAIVAALDVSASMARGGGSSAMPSRLEQAKEAFLQFVAGRPHDLIGLVAFARSPDTTCPPTLDHGFLREAARAQAVAPPQDAGTSLGDAIVWAGQDALAALATRKVVVLISDGRDEPGRPNALRPGDAAALAREQGLVVHVIALPVEQANPAPRSEAETLAEIAERGGGRVFTADGPRGLADAFAELDTLERSTQTEEIPLRYREWFPESVALALAALGSELLLHWTRLRILP